LEFGLDALGARAGKMVLRILPPEEGLWPIQVRAETNAFFSKIRPLHGHATSYVVPQRLRPQRYVEDTEESGVRRTADVGFDPGTHTVEVHFTIGEDPGEANYRYAHEGFDAISTLYALRELPFEEGRPICLDVYGIRRLWRLSGRVLAREHLSLEVGEFDAWHLTGEAVRLDDPTKRREVHVWISDDPRRLPLAAMGALEVGIVRATLTGWRRPGERPQRATTQSKRDLKW
jgi:hypothetical protein